MYIDMSVLAHSKTGRLTILKLSMVDVLADEDDDEDSV